MTVAFRSALALAGSRFRIPLNHPDIEAVGKRIEALMHRPDLEQDEGGNLTRMYRDLRKADRALHWMLGDRQLPESTMRPDFPDDAQRPSSEFFGMSDFEIRVGFVWRVSEYVDQLERGFNLRCGNDI